MLMNTVQPCEKIRNVTLTPVLVGADPAINWLMVRARDDSGETGYGEATLEGRNRAVITRIQELARELAGSPLDSALQACEADPVSLEHAAAVSAVNQALWDLRARKAGVSLAVAATGEAASIPPLYANINRAIDGNRTPADFVRVARQAEADGFSAIKIAPFDDLPRLPMSDASVRRAFNAGLARTAAVIESVNLDVMVDLHWRFEVNAAVTALAELASLPLTWVEAPVRENDLDAWRRVRGSTDARLAGGETLTSARAFDAFLAASRVDVVMPDIKYCGGVDGFRQALTVAERHSAAVSPHNPSGPVGTLATIHAAAGTPLHSLEVAWRPKRSPLDVIEKATITLPDGPGLGFHLAADAESRFPPRTEPDHAPTDLI